MTDFDALRTDRNAAVEALIKSCCEKQGWDLSKVQSNFDPNSCYCACPDGPCEHDFKGWREFEDGCGGECVCTRCGMGAMGHSMRTAR